MNWHLMPYGQYPLALNFLQSLVLYKTETSVLIIICVLWWANEHYYQIWYFSQINQEFVLIRNVAIQIKDSKFAT